jgi:prevent-host-death family protein
MTTSEIFAMTDAVISATEFKAKCLDILDQISDRQLERVTITKRGVAVAVLARPPAEREQVQHLHGFLRGSVIIPPEVDLTKPVIDEEFAADNGELHR